MNQKTLEELFDEVKKSKGDDSQAKTIDKLVVEMIATDNSLFTVVQNIGFQLLLSKIEPQYEVNSEKFYSRRMADIQRKGVYDIKRQWCQSGERNEFG